MLNQLDGARQLETSRFEPHHSATESKSGVHEASAIFPGQFWPFPHMRGRRHVAIELEAYRLAERRCFEPGHELQDWLEAEAGVDLADAAAT